MGNKKTTEEIPESPKSQVEPKETKESKELKELKEPKDLKETKETKEHKCENSTELEEILAVPEKPKSPIPIRLPTKCKPKTDSDSDSDSRSTKSSASSTSKVARVFKKTFKGKAIAIVKPFSNAVTEKKSPTSEKQRDIQARLNLYEFRSDDENAVNQRNKTRVASDNHSNHDKDSLSITSEETDSNTSRVISSIKGIKRIKSVKQGLLSARRLKFNPELKSVRVRVEKSSPDDIVDSNLVTEKETLSSNSQSDSSDPRS